MFDQQVAAVPTANGRIAAAGCLPLIASTACTIVYNEPGDVSQKLPFLFDRSEAFLAGLLSTSILRKYYL